MSNYGQVMSAKEKNEGQSKLEAVPPNLKILMDACGQKVSLKKISSNYNVTSIIDYLCSELQQRLGGLAKGLTA